MDKWGKRFTAEGIASANALRQEYAWHVTKGKTVAKFK